MNADKLRHLIRTSIHCAQVYRRRRPDLARAHLQHARHFRDKLYIHLANTQGYTA